MKTKYTLFLMLLMYFGSIQLSQAQYDHLLYQVSDSLLGPNPFQQLENHPDLHSKVLWDRSNPNLNLSLYQGASDAAESTSGDALQAYWDIKHSAIDSSSFIPLARMLDLYKNYELGYDALPIMAFNFKYQKVKSGAFANGDIALQNGQFVLSDSTLNPFEDQELWLAGVHADEVPINDTFFVVLPELLLFINSHLAGDSVLSIEIDLDDGLGFRSLNLDIPLPVYYSGEGGVEKHIQLKWNITGKTLYSNLSWKTSTACTFPQAQLPPWPSITESISVRTGNSMQTFSRTIKHLFKASIPFYGQKAQGKAYVKYRNGAGANPTTFVKPLIFVEGLDLKELMQYSSAASFNAYSNYPQLGQTGWPQLWGCNDEGLFSAATPYLDSLSQEGYDIIMLDFKDGADYIQRNAFLLVELINRINQNKIGNEPNVIIGASMGGQVVRYALSYMEQNNMPHCVRLNVSLDSPWKGAHIPIAIQCFLEYMSYQAGNSTALSQYLSLHKPAPKQLLNYHIWRANQDFRSNTTNSSVYRTYNFQNQLAPNPERTQLMQELQSLGSYPKNCRNIAILNGNNTGSPEYSAGSNFIHYNDNCNSFDNRFELYAEGAAHENVAILNTKGADQYYFKVKNMQNIYNAPSSLRDDMTDIRGSLVFQLGHHGCNTNVSLAQSQSVFIPSVSALNVNDPNWNYNIKNSISEYGPLESNQTHFDSYIAAKNAISEGHVKTTNKNMTWLLKEIRNGENTLGQSNGNTLTKAWNNPFENSNLAGIDINQGGILYLNANRKIYDGNPSNSTPPQGSLSRVLLGSSCNPTKTININNGGTLQLGDNNGSFNKAYLYIQGGASVNLNSGGNLIIHPGSKIFIQNGGTLKLADNVVLNNAEIIVEEGGELIYESAANLSFNQNGSSLLIKGKLTVKAGAIISVNSNGKLIFDQDIPWITDPTTGNSVRDIANYLNIEAGAKLRLVGTDPSFKNQTLLEIRKETIFKDADQDIFDEVLIQNGALEIAPQAFLFVASPLSIIDSEIRSTDPQNFHDGLRIWNGNTINYLRRVNIKNGHPGVLVSGLGSRGHTEFRDCTIELNWDGLKWNGGFHKVLNCTFNSNLRHAIYGQNLNGTSEIFNSNFNFLPLSGISPSGSAIDLQGQEGSLLQASGNTISGFTHGINLDDMDLRAECNTIQNNYIGIKSNNAIVYLNNEASNTIKQNQSAGINMIGDESRGSGIYLLEGNNKFQFPSTNLSTYNHVLGLWNCNQPISDYTPNMYMDFNYNQFDTPANATVVSLFSLSVVSCNNPSTYFALNADLSQNNNSAPTCGNSVVVDFHPALANLSELPPTFGKVSNGSAFAETPLYQALDQALNKLSFDEYIRDDQDALNDLILILQGTITNSDAHTQAYLNLAYRAMHQALNQAYQQNQLINNEGEPNPPISEIADVCGIADDWLLSLNPSDSMDHASIFQLNLDKVHAYRVAGNYDEALAVLTNRVNWTFNFTQTQRASYWNCVCQQEKAYFNEEIPAEEFEYGIAQCQSTYAGYTYKRAINPTLIEETLEDNLIAYPQPVSRNLHLEKDLEFDLETTFKVYSLSGAALELKGASISGNKVNLDLSNLKPGVYILKVQSTNFNQTLRILKK
tara:strand:- start:5148 stop:10004 length:4857 start_codon:yes stop_codon:yes gene_type:complete